MTLILPALNFFLIAWVSWQVWRGSENVKKIYWPALVVKLAGGIALGLVYSQYYKVGDTLLYFRDGSALAAFARNDFSAYVNFLLTSDETIAQINNLILLEPRALLFSKMVSIFSFISSDNYWIIASYFSFFSFLGSWYLVRKISRYFPQAVLPAVIAFLFFPSMVFWSSGIIKESLAMASLFFLSGIFLTLWFSERVKVADWLLVIVSAWIVWKLKYYFAGVFFSVAFTGLVFKFLVHPFLKPKTVMAELFVWLCIFIIPLSIASIAHPNFYPSRLLGVITENYKAFYELSAPEDLIHFEKFEPTVWRMLANAPEALFSGLFRPQVWEAGNVFQLLVSVENLFLLLASGICLYKIRPVFTSPHRMLVFCGIVYITLLCVFITLSTPNFGTLSRYRVGYIPYFVFLVFCSPGVIRILQRSINHLVLYKR